MTTRINESLQGILVHDADGDRPSVVARIDAAIGQDKDQAFDLDKAYDAASERMNNHQLAVEPIASFDVGAGKDKTVTCDFYSIPEDDDTPKAAQILIDAVATMVERGKSYDKDGNGSERSMDKIVAMFYALTGIKLTPAQGYKFMACLKLARSEQGLFSIDNFLDGAAYMALAGEAADLEAGE